MKFVAASETDGWTSAAQALRDELAEYGALLQLLEDQKAAILRRNLEALTSVSDQIEEQLTLAQNLRQKREGLLRQQAHIATGDANVTIKDLLPHLPAAAHPLFEALLQEAASVMKRTQAATRRNRMLLARASDVQEQILRKLKPRGVTKTYTSRGSVRLRSLHSGGLDLSA